MVKKKESPRVPVQIKIGTGLLAEIDYAVLTSDCDSRNTWMVRATNKLLERSGNALPHCITVEHILRDKRVITLRIDELTLDLVNEQCEAKEIDRTLWLLDAMVSYLAEQTEEKR